MTNFRTSTTGLLLFLLATPGMAQEQPLVPAADDVSGQSQSEWSRAWWQWAGSFESNESPVGDATGALCNQRQKGDVWFLAGTYGTRRTIRTCTVPKGVHLFFPLINYVVMPRADRPTNCLSVMSQASASTDQPTALLLVVDGRRFDNLVVHRQATKTCFDVAALSHSGVKAFPSAANGYYVMLRPLPSGTHTLEFGGALPGLLQAVTYKLIVE